MVDMASEKDELGRLKVEGLRMESFERGRESRVGEFYFSKEQGERTGEIVAPEEKNWRPAIREWMRSD